MEMTMPRIEYYRGLNTPDNFSFKKIFKDIKKGADHLRDQVKHFNLKKFLLKFNIPLVLSRNSLILLIKANAFGLATKCYRAAKDKASAGWKKLSKWFVDGLGGNADVLYRAIRQGMKVEYKHHKNKHQEKEAVFKYLGESDGYQWVTPDNIPDNILPVAAAPAVAAAPLIPKLIGILKSIATPENIKKFGAIVAKKIQEKEVKELHKDLDKQASDEAIEIAKDNIKRGAKTFKNPATGKTEIDVVHPGNTEHKNHKKIYGNKIPDYKNKSVFGGDKNTMIYIVVAVVVAALLFRSQSNG